VNLSLVFTKNVPPLFAATFPMVTISNAPVATDPITAVVPEYVVLISFRLINSLIT